MSLLLYYTLETEKNLIKFFRDKNAISPEAAIIIESPILDIKPWSIKRNQLTKYSYIKTTQDGKFWLDEEILKMYKKRMRVIGLFAIIFFVLLATAIFIHVLLDVF